jgi:hypothetical protein
MLAQFKPLTAKVVEQAYKHSPGRQIDECLHIEKPCKVEGRAMSERQVVARHLLSLEG